MSPEFSRPIGLDRIGAAGLDITVTANPAECAALASRMRLPAVRSLTCRFRLRATPGGGIDADGSLRAGITQVCVVSLDEFPANMAENFTVRFVPAGTENEADDPDSPDEIPITGTVIDLGEAAAEQLALSLPPYPRKPGVDLLADVPGEGNPGEGVPGEGRADTAHPFAGLASLRRKK